MRLTFKQLALIILALTALVLARAANSKTLKPAEVKSVPVGIIVKAKGIVAAERMENGTLIITVCESRRRKDCFDVAWHFGGVPDLGSEVTVTGRRIR